VLDSRGIPIKGTTAKASEYSNTVNIASSGATIGTTDVNGIASLTLSAASGYGFVGPCIDGVQLCGVEVRSPDVANGSLPLSCSMPTTGSSFVNANDETNPSCGFLANFGIVTPGINNWWDLNCDGFVNVYDYQGNLGKGGLLQHYSHGATLGTKEPCVLEGTIVGDLVVHTKEEPGLTAPPSGSTLSATVEHTKSGLTARLGETEKLLVVPNPIKHGSVTVLFRVSPGRESSVSIYDLAGRLVKQLFSGRGLEVISKPCCRV